MNLRTTLMRPTTSWLSYTILILSVLLFTQCTINNSYSGKRLKIEFKNPPQEAKPRVWWHWMTGNITKDGIREDLLWMQRAGVGGFQQFEKDWATPVIVDKQLKYMSPEWKEAYKYAVELADSLNLEIGIASSPGWSESGGPWVSAKDGMKKLVWRELRVKGGQTFSGKLPEPYKTSGAFQNLPIVENISATIARMQSPPEYYEDIAVLAIRLPDNDISITELDPKVSSSGGNFTLEQLTDGDLATFILLPKNDKTDFSWIQFELNQPQSISAISLTSKTSGGKRNLEMSNDGINFSKVITIPGGHVAQQTVSFPAVTAKYFRVTIEPGQASGYAAYFGGGLSAGTDISEIKLYSTTRINHFEDKAGFAANTELNNYPTPNVAEVINESDIIDLTEKMEADGSLNWEVPAGGEWKILRFGYSLTGKQNHPAPKEATGLEVDKMDAKAVKDYFENYLNQYKEAAGGLIGKNGLQYMVTDSYEAEVQNWTASMADEFQKRRGYSLLPWMPVLTGHIVESVEASEGFLWDYRKTISELYAENHYDQLTDILEKFGMKRYSESHEGGRVMLADGMDVKRKAAIPMGAIWVPTGFGTSQVNAIADIRESASTAHIYGQKLVGAESLTVVGMSNNAWSYQPDNLKSLVDLELAYGVNRFVIQASAHQPIDQVPGISLGPVGIWFNRLDTWAEQAYMWTDYLSRSSYMLQQGKFVADVVYFYGEDNNITGLFGKELPNIPKGYEYDFINADALINLLSYKDGKLHTPSGMKYEILMLDENAKNMSLSVLRKIAQLAEAGAIIGGVVPVSSPSLADDKEEFNQLVNRIWNSNNKNIYPGKTAGEILNALDIVPDFQYNKPEQDTEILYVHRRLDDGEIYWVNNRADRFETVEATFRTTGKTPQIWHPETGEIELASYSIHNGLTNVTLPMTPNDAFFVIFKEDAKSNSATIMKTETKVGTVTGPWQIAFQANRGAPSSVTFETLTPLNENENEGIKYFSGTATYTNTFEMPENWLKEGSELFIDLGEADNIAEVYINGEKVGYAWKAPYRVDITDALVAGKNKIEIKVTNTWVNRLIGDAQPDVTKKITSTAMPYYQANSKLSISGLLGPVNIINVSH